MGCLKMNDDFCRTQRAGLEARLDPSGSLHLGLEGDLAEIPTLTFQLNGRIWASIPTTIDSRMGIHRRTCTCELPPLIDPVENEVIELFDKRFTGLLDRFVLGKRNIKSNGFGLKAAEVYGDGFAPLYSADGMKLEGAYLTVYGKHLPPSGDPSKLGVAFGPGVVYSFENSLPSPDFGSHYWYWPNSYLSGFHVTINLAACSPASDPFSYQFIHTQDDGGTIGGGSVGILSDIASIVGFPSDLTQLTRVQTHDNLNEVAFQSYNAYCSMADLLREHGIRSWEGVTLLDWGCGHGRISRHFLENWKESDIWGMDIDGENIAWCKRRFSGGVFVHGPLQPPSPLPRETFDAAFAISVMTHLTADAQKAWLQELARVLKPRGIAILTFSGRAAAAYSSYFRDVVWWNKWHGTGFDDDQIDRALEGKIPSDTYYRHTFQNVDNIRKNWSRWFEILMIKPHRFGYQDVAVLRKRDEM
jgi:SAM-dependent methyltransferase